MHAVAGALAIKRERQRREAKNGQKPVKITRQDVTPPKQKGSLTYFNVGAIFILIGTFMLAASFLQKIDLTKDPRLLAMGSILVTLGCIMVTINQLKTKREEKKLQRYVQLRLGKSSSGNPLVRSPMDQEKSEGQDPLFDAIVIQHEKNKKATTTTTTIINAAAKNNEEIQEKV
jgi:hypothetical protein